MLKFIITTKADLREAAKLEKRKQCEEERKKRIFNAKQRLFGMDYDALENQIADKTKRQNIEAERERKYTEEAQRQANLLRVREIDQHNQLKLQKRELNYFRSQFQRKDLAREYDLNDPDRIRIAEPARLADDDPRLGVSSAQIFLGEDLNYAERKRAQKNQQRAWLEHQIKEKQQAEADRIKADQVSQNSLQLRDQRLIEMTASERANQIKMKESIRRYNERLAFEKRENKQLLKKLTHEDDLAEIYNMLGSDILTENPDVAQSTVSLNKKIGYMYKGMTPEERESIRAEQCRQLEQKQKRKDEEQIKEKIYEQHAINMSKELTLKQRELEKIKRANLEEQRKTNMSLAQEQRTRKEFIDKVVYRNQATDEYWGQFNRTSR